MTFCFHCGKEISNFDRDMVYNIDKGWIHRECLTEILHEYSVIKPVYDAGIEKARKVANRFIEKRKGNVDFDKLFMSLKQNVSWITVSMVEGLIEELGFEVAEETHEE